MASRGLPSMRARIPADDEPLDRADDEEEAGGEGRADDDRGVEQRRVEGVGRLDDQRADPLVAADPLADDGADHRGAGGDLERREEIGQRVVDAQLPEYLALARRE